MSKDLEERSWLNLHEGEEVEWWCHPTVLMYLPKLIPAGLIFTLLLVGAFSGAPEQIPYISAIYTGLAITTLSYMVYMLIHWRSKYYVVTNQRVIRKDGIISRKINPANFSRISNIKSNISVMERVVSLFIPNHKIGDLNIHTADDNLGDIEFNNVKNIEKGLNSVQSNLNKHSAPKQNPGPVEE